VIKNFLYLFFIINFLTYPLNYVFAKTTFKGGIITSSKSLTTSKPNERKDLIFDLKNFDDSHLEKIITKKEAIWLERRIGIGAPIDRIKLHIGKTRQQAINDIVLNLTKYKDNTIWPKWTNESIPTSFMQNGIKAHRINCDDQSFLLSLKTTWLEKLVSSKTPQYDRLAIFWLNHFSVNFNMYKQKHSFFTHLKIIRENTNKDFLSFLKNILKDPAMIVYLNNERSIAQNPNENLAREFFELFSLGEGNYTENDIKNFARYLAGNSINHISEKFKFYPYKTSNETYSAFGKEYKNEDAFFKILKNHPSFGEFIALKLYREYVSLEKPNPKELSFLVSYFRKHNFEVPEMLRGVLKLKSFWNNKLSLVKSPLELFYGTARTLNVSGKEVQDHHNLIQSMELTGQDLFNPPNIAGWPSGREWISGQKLNLRIDTISNSFSNILNPQKKTKKTMLFKHENFEKYNNDLKAFFDNSSEEQLAVETILLDYVPNDFETRRYANLKTYFYNVQFMGKKWKGIEIEFGTDKNNNKDWKELNRFTFYDGYSYPDIISNWNKSWFSDYRATRGISSSFPKGPKMKRFNQQNNLTKKLLYHLLLSMEHVLEKDAYYTRLQINISAKNFLKERIDEVKNILNYNPQLNPTKVFSYPSGMMSGYGSGLKTFKCGIEKYGLNLNEIHKSNTFNTHYDFNNIDNNDVMLSNILLPDLDLNIENKDYINILSHEGYQLK
jgi:uncharacterized protein (DUF1800 family)